MTQRGQQKTPCPEWCTRCNIGWHRGEVGVTEFGDKAVIRQVRNDSTPLISVDRARGASLIGLTFTQARALASLLDDNECTDQDLAPLLREAADLSTPRELRPHPIAAFLLRIFGSRRFRPS
jgi:hypothetical protein